VIALKSNICNSNVSEYDKKMWDVSRFIYLLFQPKGTESAMASRGWGVSRGEGLSPSAPLTSL
jgi:hypothetical protein